MEEEKKDEEKTEEEKKEAEKKEEDNQLLPTGQVNEKTEEEKKALQDKLDSFGKPDPEIYDAYRYVVYLRAGQTTNYMTERFRKKKEVE